MADGVLRTCAVTGAIDAASSLPHRPIPPEHITSDATASVSKSGGRHSLYELRHIEQPIQTLFRKNKWRLAP
jgi:hypothetical protein